LGNPKLITKPVHTPLCENQKLEKETYKWFVANEKCPADFFGKQQLNPILNLSTIPTLKKIKEKECKEFLEKQKKGRKRGRKHKLK